jgi:hypothetical protein
MPELRLLERVRNINTDMQAPRLGPAAAQIVPVLEPPRTISGKEMGEQTHHETKAPEIL